MIIEPDLCCVGIPYVSTPEFHPPYLASMHALPRARDACDKTTDGLCIMEYTVAAFSSLRLCVHHFEAEVSWKLAPSCVRVNVCSLFQPTKLRCTYFATSLKTPSPRALGNIDVECIGPTHNDVDSAVVLCHSSSMPKERPSLTVKAFVGRSHVCVWFRKGKEPGQLL